MDFPVQIHRLIELFVVYMIAAFIIVHRNWWFWPFKKLYTAIRGPKETPDANQPAETPNAAS